MNFFPSTITATILSKNVKTTVEFCINRYVANRTDLLLLLFISKTKGSILI